MILQSLAVGPIMANCFILGCEKTRKAAVIDPGAESSRILMKLAEQKLTVEYIINTHGHFDHVGANRKLKEATGAKLVIHALDQPMLEVLSETSAAFGLSVENSPPRIKRFRMAIPCNSVKSFLKFFTRQAIHLAASLCIRTVWCLSEIRFLPGPSAGPIFPAGILIP